MKHALLALSLLAAGCSGGGGSTPTPLALATSAPSASPTQSATNALSSPVVASLVVGVGDSILTGYTSFLGDNSTLTSPANPHNVIALAAQARGFAFDDVAIPGENAANELTDQVPLIPSAATIIVIQDGTNDETENGTTQQYDALVTAAQARAPHALMVLVAPRDKTPGDPFMVAWDAHIRALAPTIGAVVSDWEAQNNPTDWIGVHMSYQGVADMAAVLAPSL